MGCSCSVKNDVHTTYGKSPTKKNLMNSFAKNMGNTVFEEDSEELPHLFEYDLAKFRSPSIRKLEKLDNNVLKNFSSLVTKANLENSKSLQNTIFNESTEGRGQVKMILDYPISQKNHNPQITLQVNLNNVFSFFIN